MRGRVVFGLMLVEVSIDVVVLWSCSTKDSYLSDLDLQASWVCLGLHIWGFSSCYGISSLWFFDLVRVYYPVLASSFFLYAIPANFFALWELSTHA